MPFTYPDGHPFSPQYWAAQYGPYFKDIGYTFWFFGTNAANSFHGDGGGDTMWGFGGHDRLQGYGGIDVMYGGDGADYLNGGDAPDYLHGGDGNDFLVGGDGDDVLWGEADDDRIYGNWGNDVLFGGDGADTVHGGDGRDVIFGGAGNDLINGGMNGPEGDVLTGEAGDDTFYFWKWNSGVNGSGVDHVTDFDMAGDDALSFEVDGTGSFAVLQNTDIRELGYGTFIWAYDNGALSYIVFLEGVDATTVSAEDVLFH